MTREFCSSYECQDKPESVEIYEDGKTFCFRCKQAKQLKSLFKNLAKGELILREIEVPLDINGRLVEEDAYQWLNKYNINWSYLGDLFFWDNKSRRWIFPYGKFAWMRSIDPEVKPKMLYAGKKEDQTLYYLKTIFDPVSLIIVEDIISCIRVNEFQDCIALCGTSLSEKKKEELLKIIKKTKYQNVILWLDGDQAGRKGAEKLRKELKSYIDIRIIRTKKDPKCFSSKEIKEILK